MVFFNEPFTSTNFDEATNITIKAIEYLLENSVTVFLATNIFEISLLLRKKKQTKNLLTDKQDHDLYTVEEKNPDFVSISKKLSLEYSLSYDSLVKNKTDKELIGRFLDEVNVE